MFFSLQYTKYPKFFVSIYSKLVDNSIQFMHRVLIA